MKILSCFLLCCCCLVFVSFGQGVGGKVKVQSIASVGLIESSHGGAFALQYLLGAAHKRSFAGLGAGIDFYRYRSIPLFVDLRQQFGKGSNNFFLYADLGYNVSWVKKEKQNMFETLFLENRFSGGLYGDGGAGYKLSMGKSNALLFSAGYSFKKITSETGTDNCPLAGPCFDYVHTYQFTFSRWMLKAGWIF